ncbi:coatomer subunit beta-like isoform X2 [Gordionus sp. m RMFG-2023]|uniref:coatomer subunit beta-like isoform X2 n=1 Tax=Gordionus sp. m RMFG-2023 TaxID=3053472 RepID=UPI0031FC405E
MTAEVEQPCYVIINSPTDSDTPKESQLKHDIENGNLKAKTEALKKLIFALLNGEKLPPSMLILVIRYLLPQQDHQDLQHPNEFIRGSTLRFLCKLKEYELLEPLMPSIRACLEHKHSYVRRNAVLAIYTIYRNFEFLIPDAPELIGNFLEIEQDASCKRNAFIMLIHADQEKALNYLHSCIDQVQNFNEILQLVIVELIYKVCRSNPSERSRFIRCVYNLINSCNNAVKYEAAGTLMSISSAPTAIKAATTCYIDLIVKENDNNVKLIVLGKLLELKDQNANNERVLEDMMMDILRLLNSSDLEVKSKTLELALELVSSRNVRDLIAVLKKEIIKIKDASDMQQNITTSSPTTTASDHGSKLASDSKPTSVTTVNESNPNEDSNKYKTMLIRTLRNCLFPKYPDILGQIFPTLIECFLVNENNSNNSESPASQVLSLLRESVQTFPQMTEGIVMKLLEIFATLKCPYVFRGTIWLLGEYSYGNSQLEAVLDVVTKSLGKIPLVPDQNQLVSEEGENTNVDVTAATDKNIVEIKSNKPVITPDGTYATQSPLEKSNKATKTDNEIPPLKKFASNGEFFVASSLANDLTKIAFKYMEANKGNDAKINSFFARTMLILASILRYGKSSLPKKRITSDDTDRIMLCLKVLSSSLSSKNGDGNSVLLDIFSRFCRDSLNKIVKVEANTLAQQANRNKGIKSSEVQPDSEIIFMPLIKHGDLDGQEDQFESSLLKAIGDTGIDGTSHKEMQNIINSSRLNKVTQLTGFSDPVYAEAYVDVTGRDIRLDVLIVNQTPDTLQRLELELATLGDLKLVDKPAPLNLPPNDFCNIKASVKVSSTENGIIFGNIVYEVSSSGAQDRNAVILEEIRVDVTDYVIASRDGSDDSALTDSSFRRMWSEFEWENKVCVNRVVTSRRSVKQDSGAHVTKAREFQSTENEIEEPGEIEGTLEEEKDELVDFLEFLIAGTGMRSLTPHQALKGDCGFLAANLYAKSIFGEDALANVCLEKTISDIKTSSKFEEDKVEGDMEDKEIAPPVRSVTILGHVRIRAKTQGMALSLGDKINQLQKNRK